MGRAMMYTCRFLPPVAKSALFRALSSNDIHPSPSPVSDNDNMQCM